MQRKKTIGGQLQMGNKNIKKYFVGSFFSLFVSVTIGWQFNNVYADIIYGDGSSSSSAEFKGCDEAQRWQNVQECPNSSGKHGGASWHVFKVENKPVKDFDKPNYDDRPILSKSLWHNGEDINVSVCPGDYYIAFVYDGWYGSGANWGKKSLIYYGPLAWREYEQESNGNYHIPIYHKGGDHTAADIINGEANGTDMNGWRIKGEGPTSGYGRASSGNWQSIEALKLYNIWKGGSKPASAIPKGTGWFCLQPSEKEVTLTADAITTNNQVLEKNVSSQTIKVKVGSSGNATVSVSGKSYSGYTFKGWKNATTDTSYASHSVSYTKSISADTKVYAVYEKNTFAGRIEVSGAATGAIGYTTSSKNSPKYVKITNCSPVDGCKIGFKDYVKRASGGGTTPYIVSRSSNFPDAVSNNSKVASGNSGNANGERVATDPSSGQFTLYPGMIVCETLSFKVYSTDNKNTNLSLCVVVEGDAQPGDPGNSDTVDPSNDTSHYNIKVKNNKVTRYQNYQKTVYAKPGDDLTYLASYNPVLQYTYALIPETMMINSGTTYPTSGKNTSRFLGKDTSTTVKSMFNTYKGSGLANWNNAIQVYSQNFAHQYVQDYTFTLGDNSRQFVKDKDGKKLDNSHQVTMNEVGRSLDELVNINRSNNTVTTPKQVNFKMYNNYLRANVITNGEPKKASARVPYNYTNTTEITKVDEVVYAGENSTIEYKYIIHPKENSLTTNNPSEEKYATTVGNPKWQLEFCVGKNDCDAGNYSKYRTDVIVNNDLGSNKHDFNVTDMSKGKEVGLKTDINIPDVAAGTQICVRSVIYPATSGSDDNYNNPDGYGSSSSDRACFVVAKRPSLQVWGGNIYSRGRITTATSTKYTLDGYGDYKIEEKGDPYVFGSFGELGLIASGEVRGLASGASTGYASINADGTLIPDPFSSNNSSSNLPGGGNDSSICNRSPLTFANTPCMNGAVGKLGKTTTTSNADKDKTKVLEKFVRDVEPNVGGTVTLNDDTKTQPDGTYYYYSTEDLTIGDGSYLSYDNPRLIKKSTIQMVHSDKTIYINDNLAYEGKYNDYSELPKLIIYGKNVVIDCRVTRIEALIVADERVVTCNNYEGDINNLSDTDLKNNVTANINQSPNANQLKVNGAIIAKTLIANRTYGAATGANSIIPAEIINFDPSLYMWGGLGNDDDNDNGDLEVTLTKELAPRR